MAKGLTSAQVGLGLRVSKAGLLQRHARFLLNAEPMFLLDLAAASSASPSANPLYAMIPFVVAMIILGVLASLVNAKLRKKRRKQKDAAPVAYQLRPSLFTKAERSFYGVLRQVVGDQWTIFAKVRVSDIVTVQRGVSGWQTQFNKVQSKHVDLVLCEPSTLRVVAGLELDDVSHERVDAQERDAFKDAVFATAKLPLIRVRAQRAYTIEDVRALLARHLPDGFLSPSGEKEAVAVRSM